MIKDAVNGKNSIWTEGKGTNPEIVLSTRIRLARNIKEFPFPLKQNKTTANAVLEKIEKIFSEKKEFEFFRLSDVPNLERQVLVEKHIISPEHSQAPENKAVVINHDASVSIMVNEEDHLRMQFFASGLEIEKLWDYANSIDDEIEGQLNYAFDEKYGYLTSCPTNLGTGMRVSVMMHLPALVLTNQAGVVLNQLSKIGITVRGLFGEGTEALGNLFQISNQITLGQNEEEILANIASISRKIVNQEIEARNYLVENALLQIEDRAKRAYGILSNARIISSNEALNLISDLRLGKTLSIMENLDLKLINELLMLCQPAFLQVLAGKKMDAGARDVKRAELIKEQLTRE